MKAYVGVTDWDWYEFLRGTRATEVNFWQPGGGRRFGAIPQGAPFLFKSHYRRGNRMVGGGFLSGWASLPISQAWEFFGEDNGCGSYDELRRQIFGYRRQVDDGRSDPEIGCIMLRDVAFVPPDDAPEAPPDWKSNIVQGRGYDLASAEGSYVEGLVTRLLLGGSSEVSVGPGIVPGEVFGAPRSVPVRIGQRAFKALVQEAYGRRCAVTGDKIVPVLEAAHIRPVGVDGENRVDNGLLLRSDVHTLFDRGYLAVHPERKTLLVSKRLRSEWGNGDEFYRRADSGEPIRTPATRADRPNVEYLTWHVDSVFKAS